MADAPLAQILGGVTNLFLLSMDCQPKSGLTMFTSHLKLYKRSNGKKMPNVI